MLVAWNVYKPFLKIWVHESYIVVVVVVVTVVAIFVMHAAFQRLVYLFQSSCDRWRRCDRVETEPFGSKAVLEEELSPVIDVGRNQR